MNTPKVTIGIPCFNAERWLKQCIESALGQTWPNKEIIVVDNGSTDSSSEILRQFGDQIRTFTIAQRGANYARNAIVEHATGEWIQYLDADDYLQPEKIACQLQEASIQGPDPKGEVLYSPVLIDEHGRTSVSEIDPDLDLYAQWIAWQLPQTGACLWRKATLQQLGGWNVSLPCCQEHELYLRAIQAGCLFQFTPTAKAVYRIWSDETLCRKDPVLVIKTRTELIDRMLGWLETKGQLTAVHKAIAGRAFFEMARTWARHDLDRATDYLKANHSRGLLRLNGPAAPLLYRICFRLFGFKNAELIAKRRRV